MFTLMGKTLLMSQTFRKREVLVTFVNTSRTKTRHTSRLNAQLQKSTLVLVFIFPKDEHKVTCYSEYHTTNFEMGMEITSEERCENHLVDNYKSFVHLHKAPQRCCKINSSFCAGKAMTTLQTTKKNLLALH